MAEKALKLNGFQINYYKISKECRNIFFFGQRVEDKSLRQMDQLIELWSLQRDYTVSSKMET